MMAGYMFFQLIMTMALAGFGGGDMLDLMTTDGYWKATHVTVTVEQLTNDAKAPPAPGDIAPLVKDLGSEQFAVRKEALKKIEDMGPAVLDQVKPLVASKDEEIAATAQGLVEKFTKHARARDVRRLMAIRTLGEKKEKSALPLLQGALTSKDLFVAEYAARSIALIEGQPLPPRPSADTSKDHLALPDNVCAVIHVGSRAGGIPTIEKLLEQMPQDFGPPDGDEGPNRRDQMIAEAYKSILEVVERTGNVRLDGITLGIASNIGDARDNAPATAPATATAPARAAAIAPATAAATAPAAVADTDEDAVVDGPATQRGGEDTGFVAVIARGLYDNAAIVDALRDVAKDEIKITTEGKLHILASNEHMTAILSGNDVAVLVAGPNAKEIKAPLALLKASLTGPGPRNKLGDSPLAAEIKALDTKGPAWAILKPNKMMKREMPFIACFDRLTLTTVGNEKEIAFTIIAEGTDAKAIKDSVEKVQAQIKTAADNIRPMAEKMPALKVYVEVLDSFKLEATPTKATLKGIVPNNIGGIIGGFYGSMMMMKAPAPADAALPAPPARRKAA